MLALATTVTFANFTWETGKHLLDVEVTLGSQEKSSSCKVTLSDHDHTIAERCINHSIKAGGIQQLQGTGKDKDKVNTINIPGSKPELGVGEGPSKGWTSPEQHAFADMVAWKETQAAKDGDFAKSYLARNGGGDMPASVLLPGAGFPPPQPGGGNVGRYQFKKVDWQDAVRAGYAKDFTPEDQDGIARYKFDKLNRGGKELRAGDFEAARDKANGEWKSVPGPDSSQVQTGSTKAEFKQYYETQLAKYKTGASNIPAPPPAKTSAPPSTSDTGKPVIKGSLITVSINGYTFEFFHQGTEMSDNGQTILTGQGLRWLMSRRALNRTVKGITLKQLAAQVAKEHKVTLSYQSTFDPTYSHLDQSNMSNYALLIREANTVGLMVSEDMKKKTLVVKDRAALGSPVYTLERGLNLISYNITDKALSGNEKPISINEPNSNKVTIDPLGGKMVTRKAEVASSRVSVGQTDAQIEAFLKANPTLTESSKAIYRKSAARDTDTTTTANVTSGKSKPTVSGTMPTGDSVTVLASSGKTKRIGGLPSTFVVPLSQATLEFTPLTTMLTKGFPGCLDRIWVVKTVTHSMSNNTSTLVLNSPVEVISTSPNTPNIPGSKAENVPGAGTGWVYPTTGDVSSVQSPNRNGRAHRGVDISAASGTPIYAAAGGMVVSNQFEAGGGGNMIVIKHTNGYFTNYFHMIEASPLKVNTNVNQGQEIGKVGSTGGSTGPHLHFELCKGLYASRLQVSDTFPKLKTKLTSIIANTPV